MQYDNRQKAMELEYNSLTWLFFVRSVWVAVKSRRAIINSAQELYDLARSLY